MVNRARHGSVRTARKKRSWGAFTQDDVQSVAANTQQALIFAGFAALTASLGGLTIARVRGSMYIACTGGTDADDVLVGMGLVVVNDQLTTSTEFPMPLAEPDAPWLWHHITAFRFQMADEVHAFTFFIKITEKHIFKIITEVLLVSKQKE